MHVKCELSIVFDFISLKNKVDGLQMRKVQILGNYIIRVYHSYGRMHELYFLYQAANY